MLRKSSDIHYLLKHTHSNENSSEIEQILLENLPLDMELGHWSSCWKRVTEQEHPITTESEADRAKTLDINAEL